MLGGWQLNGIDTFQSGTPFTVTMLSSLLNAGSAPQWPNRVGTGEVANQTIDHWFDTSSASFVSPGNYVYGNSGRNILRGPGTIEFDLSLFKSVSLGASEARRLQFRAEAFNTFNHTNPGNPNTTLGNANYGKVTSAADPRILELALRLKF